jgi:hypothetical protein
MIKLLFAIASAAVAVNEHGGSSDTVAILCLLASSESKVCSPITSVPSS